MADIWREERSVPIAEGHTMPTKNAQNKNVFPAKLGQFEGSVCPVIQKKDLTGMQICILEIRQRLNPLDSVFLFKRSGFHVVHFHAFLTRLMNIVELHTKPAHLKHAVYTCDFCEIQ